MIRLSTLTKLFGVAAVLGLVACNEAPVDTKDLDEREQALAEPAADPTSPEKKRRHFADPSEMVKKFDKNGDSMLQLTEVPERMQRFLAVADVDKDGVLSVQELQAHRDTMKSKGFRGKHGKRGKMDPARMLEKLDTNANGTLELSELPEGKRERLSAADTNGDKVVTLEELTLHFESHKKERHLRKGKDFSKSGPTHTL